MANLGGNFDATQVAPSEGFDVLPAGDYLAAIAKSEKRDAKAGNGGAYINLEFEVMDGPARGRRFWTMLNLWNANAIAVEIAQRELSAICHACGKLRVSDTEELHGIPMLVRLKIKSDKQYGDKNEVVSFKPANGAAPAAGQFSGAGHQGAVGQADIPGRVGAPVSQVSGVKRGPWA